MRLVSLLLLCLCLTFTSCAKAPPTVTTPQGVTAFQNLQIVKALDAVRDIAVDANAQQPPILSTNATRTVVTWHKSALLTLNARQAGWQGLLATSLDEVVSHLSPKEQQLLTPYVTLAKTIVQEVTKP